MNMLRLSMMSEEDAAEDWKARIKAQGVEIEGCPTTVGSTVYYATKGSATLLLEQATGRAVATWIAYPTVGQRELADTLIECGAARLDCCHLKQPGVRAA